MNQEIYYISAIFEQKGVQLVHLYKCGTKDTFLYAVPYENRPLYTGVYVGLYNVDIK